MKKTSVFISCSLEDKHIENYISNVLCDAGYNVVTWSGDFGCDSINDRIKITQNHSAIFLAVLTEKYINSPALIAELGSAIVQNDMFPFLLKIGDILLPTHITSIPHFIYKLDNFNQFNSNAFLDYIVYCLTVNDDINVDKTNNNINIDKTNNDITDVENTPLNKSNLEKISKLNHALLENRLTLVCGAGVSSSMNFPSWNTLLIRILKRALLLTEQKYSDDDMNLLLSSSNLIVGKYLKILLKDNFDDVVSNCLYEDEYTLETDAYCESDLIKYIIELIRPKRNKGSVESVITFNFDSLLEEFLDKYSIKYKAIHDEGILYEIDEIPIYHVHGYLPRNEKLEKHNLVFSEDGYHTQFIDPYNWSNLIQLYKYMNNSCLFIGVSLSDPNLRRILDISKRKNERTENQHFIIKKLPDENSSVYDLEIMLEEQDALMLGLNVIWVSSYDEYPLILKEILNE